jgi:hypothetical protein
VSCRKAMNLDRYRSGSGANVIALKEVGPNTNYRPDFQYDAH